MVKRCVGVPVSMPFESGFEDRTDKISLISAENFKELEVFSGKKGVAIINWNGELLTLRASFDLPPSSESFLSPLL